MPGGAGLDRPQCRIVEVPDLVIEFLLDLFIGQASADAAPCVEEQPETGDLDKRRRTLTCWIRSRSAGAEKGDAHGGSL
jgi:hypothetical protein